MNFDFPTVHFESNAAAYAYEAVKVPRKSCRPLLPVPALPVKCPAVLAVLSGRRCFSPPPLCLYYYVGVRNQRSMRNKWVEPPVRNQQSIEINAEKTKNMAFFIG